MTDQLDDGIYFGLPEAIHHAQDAIGSSGLKALLSNPINGFWRKSPNGKRIMQALGLEEPQAEEQSLAQQFGTATHTLVLEPDQFDARYIETEDAPPEYLTSRDSIREGLERASAYLPPRSAGREEYIMAAKRAGLKVIDDWKVDFAIKAMGRTVLSRRWRAQLRMIEHLVDVKRSDLDGKSLREVNLVNGYPEVTIIWHEDGIRMKARIDYLRLAGMIDVKTYGCPDDAVPVSFFLGQIAKYAYELQAVHYGHAWAKMGDLILQGRVFGEHDAGWLKRLKVDAKPQWRWLAIQSMGMPEIDYADFTAGLVEGAAEAQRRQAIETFRRYDEQFGSEQPWVSMRGRIVIDDATLDAAGVQRRMMSRGEETWMLA